jgi:tetratricopeptide (TPR) repeat protein
VARISLIVGVALCALGVLGVVVQVLRRPSRRALRQAAAFYRRAVELQDAGDVDGGVAMGGEALATWTGAGDTVAAPGLRTTLIRLAVRLARGLHTAGRSEEAVTHLVAAQAAVGDRLDAAPEQVRPLLAELLTWRAVIEGRLGRYAEALRYDGLLLPVLRRLEAEDPERYALRLAQGLAVEARHFYEIGRMSEALGSVGEAIERLRSVPDRDRDEARADLAHAVGDRAAMLLAAGRDEAALTAAYEALGLRLGAHDPDRIRECLVLNSLGEALLRMGRAREAEAPLRDAVTQARVAAAADAARGVPWLAMCLSTQAAALTARVREATDGAADGATDGAADEADLAKAMADEAVAVATEALALAEQPAMVDEGVVARANAVLADALIVAQRPDQARVPALAAVRGYERLTRERPGRFGVQAAQAGAIRDRLPALAAPERKAPPRKAARQKPAVEAEGTARTPRR